MGDVDEKGRTILFVSHQMNQIRRLCGLVLWVDGGQIRRAGPTAEVVSAYETAMTAGDWEGREASHVPEAKARFRCWEIVEPRAEPPNLLTTLGPVGLRFTLEVHKPLRMGLHGIALYNVERQLMWGWAANHLELHCGVHELRYTFPLLPLRPGPYHWQVSLYDEHGLVDLWDCIPEMIIAAENHQHPMDQWSGILNIPCEFALHEAEEGQRATVSRV
jgi:hypothetical protein